MKKTTDTASTDLFLDYTSNLKLAVVSLSGYMTNETISFSNYQFSLP